MQELLLANYSLKLKPLYGPFHRDMVNLSWLFEAVRSSLRSGYFMFQSLDGFSFLPVLEGNFEGKPPEDFEIVSFFSTTENFVVHAFGLHDRHKAPLYSEKPLWVNLESINFNMRQFFKKLLDFEVTGFMTVETRIKLKSGYALLERGMVLKDNYGQMYGEEGLRSLLEDLSVDVCTLRVYELPAELLAFLLPNYELVGLYQNFENVPLERIRGTTLLVSVSPEKYGYLVYSDGKEVFREGFETDAPFYELMVALPQSTLSEPLDPLSFFTEDRHTRVVKYDPKHPIIYFCPACWSVNFKG